MTKNLVMLASLLLLIACTPGTSQPVPTAQIIIVTPTSEDADVPKSTALPGSQIIPMRETAAMLNAQPVANTENFSYGGLTYKLDKDSAWFWGEIRNETESIQTKIEVRINLFDAEEKLVASETGFLDLAYLNPGEISAFSVLFSSNNPPPKFEKITVDVLSKALEPDESIIYVRTGLTIEEAEMRIGTIFDVPVVKGFLVNTNDQPLRFPKAVITYYDENGAVVGSSTTYGKTDSSNTLAPKARAAFESTFTVLSGEVASYRLQSDSLQAAKK